MPASHSMVKSVPLCVDLDGTLVRTDLLYESAMALVSCHPWTLLLFPRWLLAGRAYLKRQIAERAAVDPRTLPYHSDFLAWLRKQHEAGRPLVLATASDQQIADSIAAHLGIFDMAIGSNGEQNLKGHRKAAVLTEHFGRNGFDYAGNDRSDLEVWDAGRRCIAVNPPRAVLATLEKSPNEIEACFQEKGSAFRAALKALRPHQWIKNILVFLPILAAHQLTNIRGLLADTGLFIAFCACASIVYITNDLLDLKADRLHPRKRNRPFASGRVPLLYGVLMALFLLAGTIIFVFEALRPAWMFLILYVILSTIYSSYLKRKLLADVFTLAALYCIRIFAGGAVTGIVLSPWLLSLSGFFFLSLGFSKRASELAQLNPREYTAGRAYRGDDVHNMVLFGACSGFLAVMVLALYITSPAMPRLYHRPEFLWLLCPLMLYWICRLWMLVHRGLIDEDPVVFVAKDRLTRVIALIALALLACAAW